MIDTDKYKGLNELINRIIDSDEIGIDDLLADSMAVKKSINELLAEVKRMNRFAHCAMNFMSEHDLHFQFLNEHGVFTAPDGGSISMFIPYSYKWDDETKVSSESIQFNVRGEEE